MCKRKRLHLKLGDWLRRTMHKARGREAEIKTEAKLRAVRRSAEYSFPTADMEQMLREIARR
jgi:hypothetical protein